ncbi:hypothetical protein ACGFRG_15200 [Streptomyces sp. NPDC048696]|uniref:hypothetical protein n=1 Tax=Streptomyces sp. NPDC048696 TaxID=3365585 RepID=UPI00371445E2
MKLRRSAAERLPPLACGHRDPLHCAARPPGPAAFGLSPGELGAEIRRCRAAGRRAWELRCRFHPRTLDTRVRPA